MFLLLVNVLLESQRIAKFFFVTLVTHQRSLQLEDGRRSKPVLWGHLPPPAPSTERV